MMLNKGFTLFELCIVIALCASMMMLSIYVSSYMDRLLVYREVKLLYSLFVNLQHKALIENKQQQVSFDATNNSYSHGGITHKLSKGVNFGTQPNILGPPSSPTYIVQDPVTFDGKSCIFFPDGKIKSGSVYLTNASQVISYAITCPIAQVSYIRTYNYHQGWHLLS